MKMSKYLILTSIFILFNNTLFAFESRWENFGKGEEYMRIAETNNSIWIGSRVGLIEYNKQNGQKKVHTKASLKLPSNYIISLTSDKDDAIWIGTFGGGLARYDGLTLETYNTENSMIPGNYVRSINIDKQGIIWICTDSGFAKFDYTKKLWTILNPDINLPTKSVYYSKIDTSGTIWVCGYTGLLRYKDSKWKIYNSADENFFWDICDGGVFVDKKNQVWIGTYLGLLKYNCVKDTFELVSIPDNEGNNMLTYVTSIYEDLESNIWVTTLYAGLAKFDGQNWTLNTSTNYKELKNLWSFYIDKNHNKWTVGGDNIFLMQDNETFNIVNIDNFKLNSNSIKDIFVDKLGKAWILTLADGINSYNNGIWKSYTYENGNLPSNWARCICEDLDGGIWIGTNDLNGNHDGGGLMYIGKDEQITIIKEIETESNHINAIACDSKNRIWVATRNGVFVYDANNLEKITDIPKISGEIKGICINSNDDVYSFDKNNFLFTYKNNKWNIFESINNLTNLEDCGILSCLSVDSKDTLYALTEYGLWKNVDKKWEKINKLNEIAPANLFWAYNKLFIDKNDNIWVSSNHYGVIKNSGDDWQLINESNSCITSNNIIKVFVDENSNEWYATRYNGVAVKYNNSSYIDNPVLLPNIKLYPNPAENILYIDNIYNDCSISIQNILGQILIKTNLLKSDAGLSTIDISHLTKGIYILKIRDNQKVITKMFVK